MLYQKGCILLKIFVTARSAGQPGQAMLADLSGILALSTVIPLLMLYQ